MKYQLAIYRFGGLAELTGESIDAVKRPLRKDLREKFRKQRRALLHHPAYRDAKEHIRKEATARGAGAAYEESTADANGAPKKLANGRVGNELFSMPPAISEAQKKKLASSLHLVALLPNEKLICTIDGTRWSIRIRASVTACALESPTGIPKLWWTFEGVPLRPELDNRLSETDVVRFFTFVNGLEQPLMNLLSRSYFEALSTATESPTLTYRVGDERLRLRFVDSDDIMVSELIDALRFRKLSAEEIKSSEAESLISAKAGMLEFEKLVADSNKIAPAIDPREAQTEVNPIGAEAVSARKECPVTRNISVAGIAQRQGIHTAYDHLDPIREHLIAENDENRIRTWSASRRLTAQLAGKEAVELEIARVTAREVARALASA